MQAIRTLPLLAILVTSCAIAPVQRKALWDNLEGDGLGIAQDHPIEELRLLEPTTSGPLRIGIAPPLVHPDSARFARSKLWSREERDVFRKSAKPWIESGAVAEIVFLPAILMDERSPRAGESRFDAARRAAARKDLDAVLVVHTLGDVSTSVNPLALLNLTVVGLWLAPGHSGHAVTVAEGVLVDARSEYVYAWGVGEGEDRATRPHALLELAELSAGSRVAALEALGEDLSLGFDRAK